MNQNAPIIALLYAQAAFATMSIWAVGAIPFTIFSDVIQFSQQLPEGV
jgi:hypothetical protein